MSISKIFTPNFVCILRNERYKRYQTDFYSVTLVMPQMWDFRMLGVPRGGRKLTFFKHGHVAYQIKEDDEQNKIQVKFSS